MFQLRMYTSQEEPEITMYGTPVETLAEAERLIAEGEERFAAWEETGFADFDRQPYSVSHWEGCNIVATEIGTGRELLYIEDGVWERIEK